MAILSDEERFEKYVEYLKDNEKFLNAFEILNLNEISMSDLLCWLLNVKYAENKFIYNLKLNFCLNFLKLIKQKEEQDIKNAENDAKKEYARNRQVLNIDNNILELIAKNMTARTGLVDILAEANIEDTVYLFAIENKKRAKISSPLAPDGKRISQVEKYSKYDIPNYCASLNSKKIIVKYIYLCAYEKDTEKVLSDIKNSWMIARPNKVYINGKLRKELPSDFKLCDLLCICRYTILEHSQINLILYEVLKEKFKTKFYNDTILNSTSYDEMYNLIESLKHYKNGNICEIDKFIKHKEELKQKSFITNYGIKQDYKINIGAKGKIRIGEYLNSNNEKNVINLLCQYIEYWELHDGTEGQAPDNLMGDTKIVDGDYIWYICKRLSNNDPEYWKKQQETSDKLPTTIKELIENVNRDNII